MDPPVILSYRMYIQKLFIASLTKLGQSIDLVEESDNSGEELFSYDKVISR
jgi:hypothetical protein